MKLSWENHYYESISCSECVYEYEFEIDSYRTNETTQRCIHDTQYHSIVNEYDYFIESVTKNYLSRYLL